MKNREHNKKLLSRLAILSFVLVISMNVLANLLPINGVSTGQVSDKYLNLFAPSGFTFSIWGLIYCLLAYYTYFQFSFNSRRPDNNDRVVRRVNFFFIISNILNSFWILAWHYDRIGFSLLLMIGLLLCLIQIRVTISNRTNLSKSEGFAIRIPFSIYFGWISVASIANVTTYLVSIHWDRFGFEEDLVTMFVLFLGVLIAILTMIRFKDSIYGLVIVWAYVGIWHKHSINGYFAGQYENILKVLYISLGLLLVTIIGILITKSLQSRKDSKRKVF